MSHFATLVLVMPDRDVESEVARLLEPYREREEWFGEGTRWDWYQIGGRWTGALTDYDPEQDPENSETCWLCGGTGTRQDMVVANGCNGCGGVGIKVKWPTAWKRVDDDAVPVPAVPKDFTPYALVTPDGKWRESGRMLWWGVTDPNTQVDEASWETTYRAQLAEWPDAIVVIVDCHV